MSDFTYTPDYSFQETPQFRTLVSEFETGWEQRRAMWADALRQWKLVFKTRTLTETNAIIAFFEAKLGAYDQFTWTNPNDSTEYTVRFVEDSLQVDRISYNIFDLSLMFKEVKT